MHDLAITVCPMATRPFDQPLVLELARKYPDQVVPGFGYHPWFTHWISLSGTPTKEQHYRKLFLPDPPSQDTVAIFERLLPLLPDPIPLEAILADVRQNLLAVPRAMLGEVGFDRQARIPMQVHVRPREMTPFKIPFDHQLAILRAQLDIAIELGRNVSMHSVQATKATVDLLDSLAEKHGDKWRRVSLDLHSCTLSPETWKNIEKRHPNVFLSISTGINVRCQNLSALVQVASPDRLLVESDHNNIDGCTSLTWDIVLLLAEIKQWPVETVWKDDPRDDQRGVVHQLQANWKRFQEANFGPAKKKRAGRKPKQPRD
ncbi:Metallo-dependent hydrolase [Coniophora puteana RWD-64-598 SS2]|uniref:Metallo-dependent hydrolase n=1 Tax=Coniophora puteana (strain RWD-64-598) TaxID=741705 RepID=A0A5M3N6V8_CONPW|nr:Metallo-dependent hydrolase [Coniophora puteana RWD-64-598 SS2]EIW86967.1 Metallo-dependent hydrolase [Coniophora puteana RWD-64-598 SS2]